MRNKIFGGIGIIWGGAILFHWLTSSPTGSAAYQGGQTGAAVFGAVMFGAGLYYFFKKQAQA
jgi:hypothetical protein